MGCSGQAREGRRELRDQWEELGAEEERDFRRGASKDGTEPGKCPDNKNLNPQCPQEE